MKSPRFPLLLTALLICASLQAQEPLAVEIDAPSLQDQTLNAFKDGTPITAALIATGNTYFKLAVPIKGSVQMTSQQGVVVNVDSTPMGNSKFYFYNLKGFVVNNAVTITVTTPDKKQYKITLTVSPDQQQVHQEAGNDNGDNKQPIPYLAAPAKTENPKNEPCESLNRENKFGEELTRYDKHTVVYVYDFDRSNQRIYKITRPRYKKNTADTLNVQQVNLNNEVLKGNSDPWLKIVNVNKFRYDIEFNDSVIEYESEPTLLFSRLFLGDTTVLGTLLNNFTSNLNVAVNNDPAKELTDSVIQFLSIWNAMQAKLISAYSPCTVFECCNLHQMVNYRDLADRLLTIRALSANVSASQNPTKSKLKTETDLLSKNRAARTSLDSLQKVVKAGGKTADATQQKAIDSLTAASKDSATHLANKSDLEAALANGDANDTLLSHLPSEADLKKIAVLLDNMTQENQVELYHLSTSGNATSLKLHIHTNDSIAHHFGYPVYNGSTENPTIPILGKPFVSFSSGSFIGFSDYLRNKTYAWQQLPDNTNTVRDTGNYILVQSGYTMPPVGFSALGNVEWKLLGTFGLGLSGGVGLTIETTPRVSYLAGGSIFVGKLRQFALTCGFAGMDINRLTNDWQTVTDKGISYTSKPSVSYYKEFKVGGFISLTYTPFHISKH